MQIGFRRSRPGVVRRVDSVGIAEFAVLVALGALALCSACTGTPGRSREPGFVEHSEGRIEHTATGIVLVRVAAGRFTMGSPRGEAERDGDEVLHPVEIAEPFLLGETEVSEAQWAVVLGDDAPELRGRPDHPVGDVTWHRAQEFVRGLNATSPGWRLPSEEEWEYACRAGTATPFSFGDDLDPTEANVDGRFPYRVDGAVHSSDGPAARAPAGSVTVRSLPANPWGLFEMHGNLWEWVEDVYVFDRTGPELRVPHAGASRVLRGGGFTRGAAVARCAYRDGYPPQTDGPKYGFRVARSIGNPGRAAPLGS